MHLYFMYKYKIQKSVFLFLCIIIISEGSCETEDWSNDAENSALPSLE